ncbi:hypothetical protein Tco_1468287 [Tanacetum coccineum]
MFDCCDLLGFISFLAFFGVDLELGFLALGLRKLVSLKPEDGREDERPREEAKFAISDWRYLLKEEDITEHSSDDVLKYTSFASRSPYIHKITLLILDHYFVVVLGEWSMARRCPVAEPL